MYKSSTNWTSSINTALLLGVKIIWPSGINQENTVTVNTVLQSNNACVHYVCNYTCNSQHTAIAESYTTTVITSTVC